MNYWPNGGDISSKALINLVNTHTVVWVYSHVIAKKIKYEPEGQLKLIKPPQQFILQLITAVPSTLSQVALYFHAQFPHVGT